jgi:prolyl-tRNA synthetase
MIMVHSDDLGLVLPPKVASIQVVVIPIEKAGNDNESIKK